MKSQTIASGEQKLIKDPDLKKQLITIGKKDHDQLIITDLTADDDDDKQGQNNSWETKNLLM